MKNIIIDRVIEVANYIIATNSTIRETAKIFRVSKSTIHKDIQERLKELDKSKYNMINEILKKHLEIRHIIGGEATKQKYINLKQNKG